MDDGEKIPQVDSTVDELVSYDLEIESFASATEKDVVEVLETNFYGTLDDKNVEKTDKLRNIVIEKLEKEEELVDEGRKIEHYKVDVKDDVKVHEIFESWKTRYNFDELAYKL